MTNQLWEVTYNVTSCCFYYKGGKVLITYLKLFFGQSLFTPFFHFNYKLLKLYFKDKFHSLLCAVQCALCNWLIIGLCWQWKIIQILNMTFMTVLLSSWLLLLNMQRIIIGLTSLVAWPLSNYINQPSWVLAAWTDTY